MLIGRLLNFQNWWVTLELVNFSIIILLYGLNGYGNFVLKSMHYSEGLLMLNIIHLWLGSACPRTIQSGLYKSLWRHLYKSPWRIICQTIDLVASHVQSSLGDGTSTSSRTASWLSRPYYACAFYTLSPCSFSDAIIIGENQCMGYAICAFNATLMIWKQMNGIVFLIFWPQLVIEITPILDLAT